MEYIYIYIYIYVLRCTWLSCTCFCWTSFKKLMMYFMEYIYTYIYMLRCTCLSCTCFSTSSKELMLYFMEYVYIYICNVVLVCIYIYVCMYATVTCTNVWENFAAKSAKPNFAATKRLGGWLISYHSGHENHCIVIIFHYLSKCFDT